MSLFDDARREQRRRAAARTDDAPPARVAASGTIAAREATTTVDGETVPVEKPETTQTSDEGTWLTGQKHGRPRGRDAIQARQISQTAAMEAITNGIVDQIIGGDLVFESDDDDVDQAEADLQALIRDVLEGPHPMGNDLDDLVTAAVADMIGPGNAYWQLLPAADDSLPVAGLIPLDALTIRHNLDEHGFPPAGDEPAFWQARNAFSAEGVAMMGEISPTPIPADRLAVMHYPRGKRAYQIYPKSPSLQVLEWLEILTNSTKHHNRYYNDNEVPPGFVQILNANDRTVTDVQDKLEAASGDPRSVEVIGGEGQAMWVEMGGTAINLDVIQEQQWFFELCLGSLGLGKAELGLIEDVNRANGEVEQTRIYKRVAGPFAKQFRNGFKHVCQQFEVYNRLDRPFVPRLEFADPSAERARQERLRKQYATGVRTFDDFLEGVGTNPADVDTTVVVNGQEIDYGDKPKWVAQELLADARSDPDDMPAEDSPNGDGDEDLQSLDAARGGPADADDA